MDRRRLLGAAGGTLMAAAVGWPAATDAQEIAPVRWGIVGTGSIASSMAGVIASVPLATLTAVSSRRMASAERFAAEFGADNAFDSWSEMAAWDGVDAIYVATPTGVREEICVAAAQQGKHVLGEKPFASLASVERIVAACRENDVGFMDGTHFGHHPRTSTIRDTMADAVGWPWSLTSTFQFALTDRSNMRFNTELEPMGAIGDVGWYCIRAIAEYREPDLGIKDLSTHLRRDPETGTAMSGSGVILFDDGSTSTWNCGYDTGATFTDLRLSGSAGVITLTDFPNNNPDGSADYLHHTGGFGTTTAKSVRVESPYTSRQLMFQDFAAMIGNQSLLERSIADTMRTQALLDAVWNSGIDNE